MTVVMLSNWSVCTLRFETLFAWRYSSLDPPFFQNYHGFLFSFIVLSRSSVCHHVSFCHTQPQTTKTKAKRAVFTNDLESDVFKIIKRGKMVKTNQDILGEQFTVCIIPWSPPKLGLINHATSYSTGQFFPEFIRSLVSNSMNSSPPWN